MNEFYNKMKYFEETEGVPAEIYYHYTTLEGLYSIITGKTFRLTSLKSSNDKKELFYKPEQFISDLEAVCKNKKDEEIGEFLQIIENSVKENKEEFLKQCKVERYPYALCLSEKKDNLTHWARYAAECTGVSIGFNVSALHIYLNRMASRTFGIGLYDVGKTLYSFDEIESYICDKFYIFFDTFRDGWKEKEVQERIHKNGYSLAASVCMLVMKFVKNSSFVDEDEIRFYHDGASIKTTLQLVDSMASDLPVKLYGNLKRNLLSVMKELHLKEENFCLMRSGIRSYKNLCLEPIWGSGTIPEIVLGPMCTQNRNELRRFLKANGLEGTKVSVSEVPIR